MKGVGRTWLRSLAVNAIMMAVCFTAYADLEGAFHSLEAKIRMLSIPLTTMALIFAGINKAWGNGDFVKPALTGAIFVFAAGEIIIMLKGLFGG